MRTLHLLQGDATSPERWRVLRSTEQDDARSSFFMRDRVIRTQDYTLGPLIRTPMYMTRANRVSRSRLCGSSYARVSRYGTQHGSNRVSCCIPTRNIKLLLGPQCVQAHILPRDGGKITSFA